MGVSEHSTIVFTLPRRHFQSVGLENSDGILIMKKAILVLLASAFILPQTSAANAESDQLQQQLEDLQRNYDRRLQRIEKRLQQTQAATRTRKSNTFNPAISLILNGTYSAYSNDPEDYLIAGVPAGGEAGLVAEGFSLGESEVTLGANVDQNFYGQATFSLEDDAGETSISTEEAYFETIGLSQGLSLKAGRFFSAIGYLNDKHAHAWDFSDAPLVYRGVFADQLTQDGVQLSWLLPTDNYLMLGGELGNGVHFPAADNSGGIGDWLAFIKAGGDIGISHSWQLGISHWQADDVINRQHSNPSGSNSSYSGNSKIDAIDVVYKWAPKGNPIEQNLKVQWEYFDRREQGQVTLNNNLATGSYDGHLQGWYLQAVYQFVPNWKAGLRYDSLDSNNNGSNNSVLDQAGLLDNGHHPQRSSVILAWQASEFSRIRAQYNYDQSGVDADQQLLIQYTMVMGAHGAHSY